MTDIELARIPAGVVPLHDARRSAHTTVRLEPFALGVYPVTQEQLAEVLGVATVHPDVGVRLARGAFDPDSRKDPA